MSIRIRRNGKYYQVWKNREKQASFCTLDEAKEFAEKIEKEDREIRAFNQGVRK